MSELLVDLITSLDGYASGEGWPGFWGAEVTEYLAWLDASPEKDWPLVMGAATYRLMSGMSAQFADSEGFAEVDAAPKYVFSSTLEEPLSWANSTLLSEDAVDGVRRLKGEGRSLRTLGSLSLSRSLLAAGLVDRFRVVMFPFITGRTGSERIYDGYPDVGLEMVDSRRLDGHLQLVEYRPTLLGGPPSGD